jgi:hypothetical protein
MNFIKNYININIFIRIKESTKRLKSHQGYVPMIIDTKDPKIKLTKNKFSPLGTFKFNSVINNFKNYLNTDVSKNQKMYFYALKINELTSNIKRIYLIKPDNICQDLYDQYKHTDGILYIRYTPYIPGTVENVYNYLKSFFV